MIDVENANVKEPVSIKNDLTNLNAGSLFIYEEKVSYKDNINFNNDNLTSVYGYGKYKIYVTSGVRHFIGDAIR